MNILLVHGLGRTPLSLWGMANALKQAGHTTEFFGYATPFQSFDDIALRLRDRIQSLSTLGPYALVTHSMGGILTRAALALASFPQPTHVVMLAPPNSSPLAARIANRFFPFRWYATQSGANMANPAFYTQLPILTCPYTLIAGTLGPTGSLRPFGQEPNDMLVGLNEIPMRPEDPILKFPALHTFLMNRKDVQQAVINALK